ncbi:hypothetical protein BJV77DRAFT_980731 [Russula vinacea]|nr:hypothetical protein BJV77DRAFT_980731 [Russula vinacea]
MGISLGANDLESGDAGALRDHEGTQFPFILSIFLPSTDFQNTSSIARSVTLKAAFNGLGPCPNIAMTPLGPRSFVVSKSAVQPTPKATPGPRGKERFHRSSNLSQALRSTCLAGGAPGTVMIRALLAQGLCRQVATGISAALKKAIEVT